MEIAQLEVTSELENLKNTCEKAKSLWRDFEAFDVMGLCEKRNAVSSIFSSVSRLITVAGGERACWQDILQFVRENRQCYVGEEQMIAFTILEKVGRMVTQQR